MKQIKYLLLFIGCFVQISVSFGQVPKPAVNYPTPNITGLGTFGDVPVSLYTGQPNITIPIFEVKEGSISVPVALEYHLSSVRPCTHSSWVGLGWGLSSGGYITRNVRGLMDEKQYTNGYASGFYAHRSKLASINFLSDLVQHGAYAQAPMGTEYELVADEFSFNFCGYSGSFYLNESGGWTVISDHDIKVELPANGGFINRSQLRPEIKTTYWNYKSYCNRFFNKFIITTPDGIRYTFGGASATEYSISYYNRNGSDLIPTSWYLTAIESPEGRSVTLDYLAGTPVCELKYSPFYRMAYNVTCDPQTPNTTGYKALSGYLLFPVYLSSITSSSASILFDSHSSHSRRLNTNLLVPSNTEIHPAPLSGIFNVADNTYQDNYLTFFEDIGSTFNTVQDLKAALSDNIAWRLLDTVKIQANDTQANPYVMKYCFNYSDMAGYKMLDLLLSKRDLKEGESDDEENNFTEITTLNAYHFTYNPNNSSTYPVVIDAEDHWGYYNGGTVSLTSSVETVNNNKYSSLTATKAGTLSTIQYPTGGKTSFEYELNDYSKCVNPFFTGLEELNVTLSAGGLRVTKITSYSANNVVAQIKKYYYTRDSVPGNEYTRKSSGILKRKPIYQNDYIITTTNSHDYYHPTNTDSPRLTVVQSGGFSSQGTNNSTPYIGYSSVIEETVDASGNSAGYVRYRFSNYDTDVWGETHLDETLLFSNVDGGNYFDQFSSKSQERGKLMAEDYYDASLKLKKALRYKYKKSDTNFFKTIDEQVLFFCTNPYLYRDAKLLSAFKTYTYSYLLEKEFVTEYRDNNASVQTENRVYYNPRKQLAVKTFLLNNNDSIKTENKYPQDYSGSIYSDMVAMNMISPVIEQIQTKGSTEIERIKTDYIKDTNKTKNLILPDKVKTSFS
ncbi:MAG: hypothetical protein LBT25_03935, partial [Candidatus Symbiothrix sp.]|nr:hypothetical protein [Candidatus Symbiothrix sp.]